VQVLECHVFICKSAEAAIALVQSTSHAFEHREGWMPVGSSPPADIGSAMTFGWSVTCCYVESKVNRSATEYGLLRSCGQMSS